MTRELSLFESVVEPSVERIPLIDLRFEVVREGRRAEVLYALERHVFTAFDTALSRHLAAVRGGGFPPVSGRWRLREAGAGADAWSAAQRRYHPSVLHALHTVAGYALGRGESARLAIGPPGEEDAVSRPIERTDLDKLAIALDFVRRLGDVVFLDIAGDLDAMSVAPAKGALQPVLIDLFRGTVFVPAPGGAVVTAFDGALHELRRDGGAVPVTRAYLAAAQREVTQAREDAVHAFRAAAEAQIHAFDRALGGRALEGYLMEAAVSLVARLRAGLGDALNGISEDARVTALDWAEAAGREARMPRHRALTEDRSVA
ncbi:MAG: hypothetical protein ACFBWO_06520 [Paracoccaceae bacterium]